MVDPITPDDRQAIELMYFAYRAFTAPADGLLAARELGRAHHRILYFVGREPGLSVSRLLEVLAISKQALNGPLRRLLALGLVKTSSSVEDRRVKRLQLTEAGEALERQLTRTQAQVMRAALADGGDWRAVMERLASPSPSA